MPCISGNYEPSLGLLLNIAILPPNFDPLKSTGGNGKSAPSVTVYAALVDTGASCTCITEKVINEVGLSPHGKADQISASETREVNTYFFKVGMPLVVSTTPAGVATGALSVFPAKIQGMDLLNPTGRFDVLLGMDVISRGSLHLDFDKHFSFCF